MNATGKEKMASAGIGDPYWYEWGMGLLKAVEMLSPDSGIEAVAFQKNGIKGWDDVVVRHKSGHHDYYQVKHSTPRINLTFTDLVAKGDDGTSLLGSLSSAWRDMGLQETNSSCIIITNRSAGMKAGRSKNGMLRPPLGKGGKAVGDDVVCTQLMGQDLGFLGPCRAAGALHQSR